MAILVNNLYKSYDEEKVLKGISFKAPHGKIIGFLGPNGAGKTTTMKILNGFIKPDNGTIEVAGINVITNPIQAQKKIGYLPENNPLYTDFYVKEYLEFIANIYKIKNSKLEIDKAINLVGLTKESNKKIEQLSKGYKQRVGIASVLLHNPEVFILDEPTSGLDPNQVIEIRNLIKNLGKEKTIIFSTHILQEVEAICDHLIIINKGEIVENDNIQLIKKKYTSNHISVSFKKNLNISDFNFIANIYNDISFNNKIWTIQTNNIEEVKKKILDESIKNNWELESIYNEKKSIENIFQNLTK